MGNKLRKAGSFCRNYGWSLATMAVGAFGVGRAVWSYEDAVNFGVSASISGVILGAGASLLRLDYIKQKASRKLQETEERLEGLVRKTVDARGFSPDLFENGPIQRLARIYAEETDRLKDYHAGLNAVRASKFKEN